MNETEIHGPKTRVFLLLGPEDPRESREFIKIKLRILVE